jgi:hypothetical protein
MTVKWAWQLASHKGPLDLLSGFRAMCTQQRSRPVEKTRTVFRLRGAAAIVIAFAF